MVSSFHQLPIGWSAAIIWPLRLCELDLQMVGTRLIVIIMTSSAMGNININIRIFECQSGGEFSLAIISSLRSWQGRRHSFESMPDCQRHIWLKLFHNFARAPRFSTEID